jgi:hypothetical protein
LRRLATIGGASVIAAFAALSLSTSAAVAGAEQCESAPGASLSASALINEMFDGTLDCFNGWSDGLGIQIQGLNAAQPGCASASASYESAQGGGIMMSAQAGLTDVQTTTKVKLKFFTAEQALFAKAKSLKKAKRKDVAHWLGEIVTDLPTVDTDFVAVYTDLQNVSRDLSSDDCDSAQTDLTATSTANTTASNSLATLAEDTSAVQSALHKK